MILGFFLSEFLSVCVVFSALGFLRALSLLVLSALTGLLLIQGQGWAFLRDLQMRAPDLENGFLFARLAKIAAGVLFLFPGFFSDILAVLLLFPPTRLLFRRGLLSWVSRLHRSGRVVVHHGGREIRDVTPPPTNQLPNRE